MRPAYRLGNQGLITFVLFRNTSLDQISGPSINTNFTPTVNSRSGHVFESVLLGELCLRAPGTVVVCSGDYCNCKG